MSAKRRHYSEEDKATALAVLAANNGDLRKTARDLGIPKSTLERWIYIQNTVVSAIADTKKKELSTELEELAYKIVGVMPDKLASANLQQLATSLGITIDKMQLLQGRPTERSETRATIEVKPIDYRVGLVLLQPNDQPVPATPTE